MCDITRLVDAHVHPHDSPTYKDEMHAISSLQCSKICVMSSNIDNQDRTTELFNAYPDKVIPAYGIHPWFCHHVTVDGKSKIDHYNSLFATENNQDNEIVEKLMEYFPEPVPLKDVISQLRNCLLSSPKAFLGEVGLDKSFRIPNFVSHNIENDTTSNTIEKLTKLKTPIQHQLRVLEAQLDLAVELGRCVSFHCVQAQSLILDLLNRYFPPAKQSSKTKQKYEEPNGIRICLHSFLGSTDTFRLIQRAHPNVYFSFSSTIGAKSPRIAELMRAVRDDRILVETDWHSTIGIDEKLHAVTIEIATAKEWTVDHTVNIVEYNWKAFYIG